MGADTGSCVGKVACVPKLQTRTKTVCASRSWPPAFLMHAKRKDFADGFGLCARSVGAVAAQMCS